MADKRPIPETPNVTPEALEAEILRIRPLIAETRVRIADACDRADRDPGDVRLIGVTKYHAPVTIAAAAASGLTDLAENRVQALADRAARFPDTHWHLIGTLQRNKVKFIPENLTAFHALDSLRLRDAIVKRHADRPPLACYIQVNVTGEAAKSGLTPETLRAEWPAWNAEPGIRIVGLMTMAELDADEARLTHTFTALDRLAAELEQRGGSALRRSMGMSGDFATAIACGSTDIRIGTALFGPPTTPAPQM